MFNTNRNRLPFIGFRTLSISGTAPIIESQVIDGTLTYEIINVPYCEPETNLDATGSYVEQTAITAIQPSINLTGFIRCKS